jgi:pyruvate-formate lyase
MSMDELLRALDANFEGYESLRQMLLHKAPKYGNDDPEADEIARRVSQFWTTEAFRHTTPETGKRYRGGYLSWNYWVAYAPRTAATPDGRRRGQFLSNGVCPVNGADRNGPTAVIRSVGRLGLETAPNGASHTMSFSPQPAAQSGEPDQTGGAPAGLREGRRHLPATERHQPGDAAGRPAEPRRLP